MDNREPSTQSDDQTQNTQTPRSTKSLDADSSAKDARQRVLTSPPLPSLGWAVEDGPDGLHNINTGKHVLQMVTDDYQMACDLCMVHNDVASALDEVRERVTHLQAVCLSYDKIINTLEGDELVRFANAIPSEYRAFVQALSRESLT